MLVRSVFLICLIASAFAQSGEEAVLGFFSTPQTGHGTYYGPSSSGSCTLDGNLPPVGLTNEIYATVAMNSPQYYGSLSCGMCLQMTGEGVGSGGDPIDGTYIVFVTNLCPECLAGDLDVALNGDGRWDIEWVAVNCPGDYGNLQYMGQGSNSFFLKIQVRNHRVPVAAFYMLNIDGNARIELARSQDNFFIFQSSSELSGDYTVEIESVDGQLLTDVVNIDLIASSQPFNGKNGVQFNGIATSTTVSPSRSPVGGAPSTQNSPSASRSAQGSSARPSTSSSASRTPTRQGSSAAESPSPSRSVGSSASRSPAQASPSPSRSRTRTSFSDTLSSFTSFSSSFTFPSSDSPSDSSSSSAWQIQLSILVFLVGMLLAC